MMLDADNNSLLIRFRDQKANRNSIRLHLQPMLIRVNDRVLMQLHSCQEAVVLLYLPKYVQVYHQWVGIMRKAKEPAFRYMSLLGAFEAESIPLTIVLLIRTRKGLFMDGNSLQKLLLPS